jgi:hypothetical protein
MAVTEETLIAQLTRALDEHYDAHPQSAPISVPVRKQARYVLAALAGADIGRVPVIPAYQEDLTPDRRHYEVLADYDPEPQALAVRTSEPGTVSLARYRGDELDGAVHLTTQDAEDYALDILAAARAQRAASQNDQHQEGHTTP